MKFACGYHNKSRRINIKTKTNVFTKKYIFQQNITKNGGNCSLWNIYKPMNFIRLVLKYKIGKKLIQFLMSKASKTKGFILEPNFDWLKELKRPQERLRMCSDVRPLRSDLRPDSENRENSVQNKSQRAPEVTEWHTLLSYWSKIAYLLSKHLT